MAPKKVLKEFRVQGPEGLLEPGVEIKADHFKVGQYVDVKGDSKGKGFAGVGFPRGVREGRVNQGADCGLGYETVWMGWSASVSR